MMVSKKELRADLAEARLGRSTAEKQAKVARESLATVTSQRDAARRDAEGAWGRIQRDELRAHRKAMDEAGVKRREERRQHLKDLAAGRFDVKNSTGFSIVQEGEKAHVKLTFPLDTDELPIVQRVLAGPTAGAAGLYALDADAILRHVNSHCAPYRV
ncbi:hypothetical protein [Microbacterium sp. MMO-10]|uniref:hypothetical protein n=1 Tax=Microbacterium sp. MMO-10 TaxID=3081272 RepID=UPI00301A5F7A